MPRFALPFLILTMALAGCFYPSQPDGGGTDPPAPLTPTAYFTETPTPPAPTTTATASTTAAPTVTSTPEPFGCLKPPEDYTRVVVNGQVVNRRTLAMLEQAQALYGGELEITGYAITQGSYTDAVSASFGTHSGGGAVDLSVLRRDTFIVLWDDIPLLIRALRAAGFAAWLREYGELHPGSPYHIHAIAVGDAELSFAAQGQLTGEAGYFRGFSGLTDANGLPTPDRYGEPVICGWMIELGYGDMR